MTIGYTFPDGVDPENPEEALQELEKKMLVTLGIARREPDAAIEIVENIWEIIAELVDYQKQYVESLKLRMDLTSDIRQNLEDEVAGLKDARVKAQEEIDGLKEKLLKVRTIVIRIEAKQIKKGDTIVVPYMERDQNKVNSVVSYTVDKVEQQANGVSITTMGGQDLFYPYDAKLIVSVVVDESGSELADWEKNLLEGNE